MVFGFDGSAEARLHSPGFFLRSCALNAFCMLVALFVLNPPWGAWGGVWSAVFAGFMVEFLLRGRRLPRESIRRRYLAKIWAGMGAIVICLATVDKDYVIFLPVVVGLLYLNANTLLRSATLQVATYLFMSLSVVKAVAMHHQDLLDLVEAAATSLVLFASSFLSFDLFRSNKNVFERNERRAATLLAVGRMLNELTVHDVNNALTSIFVLSNEKYRSDKALFVEEMERRVEQVRDLVESRVPDARESIDVGEILERMPGAAGRCSLAADLGPDPMVYANRNMLYAMLRNFLENSAEAAARLDRPCSIRVRKRGAALVLDDDAGGFDVSKIQAGGSAKASIRGHGVFLRTVSDPAVQSVFGYRLSISRTPVGTRVEIDFGPSAAQEGREA